MMPNKSIYRDADAAEINLYELNFARFFSIQTSENGWRRVVCELVRRAAKGTKELRLEDGTELPGEKTFPDYVVDLMDSYLAVLPDAKPHWPFCLAQTQPPCAGARSSKRPASMQTVPSVYSAILAPSASCTTTTPDISGNG